MPNRMPKITSTQRVIRSMLTENTGRALCDSGGAYGRNWERNQGRTFKDEPRSTLDFAHGLSVVHNVYTWLCSVLEYNPEIQRSFNAWARRKDNEHEPWLPVAEGYVKHVDGKGVYRDGEPFTVNTYNGEDLLSQTIQYVYWTDDDGAHVLLQIHGGCDVRGGYTRPRAFDVSGEYGSDDTAIFNNDHASIFCTAKPSATPQQTLPLDGASQDEEVCDASWYTDDGYHYYRNDGDGPNLNDYDHVKIEEGQDPVAMVQARATAGEPPVIFVDPEGNGYCPLCGAKLAADFY